MTAPPHFLPNPDLTVGEGNKQRWNQPAHRRHGFHNAHRLFRRAFSMQARGVLELHEAEDAGLAGLPEVAVLTGRRAFSALVCARGDGVVLARHAADFPPDRPHSIQSVSKLFMHLVAGRLIGEGRLDPNGRVETYIPEIGSGYRGARVADVLDMNVINGFVEDYGDPHADSFAEEVALGWRLPPGGTEEITMGGFVCAVAGDDLTNRAGTINYCSANTDLMTLICNRLCPGALPRLLGEIVDAAGFQDGFYISLSPEGLPAFSGGGCLSAHDLARFGLLLARVAKGTAPGWNGAFTRACLTRKAKTLQPPRDNVRYAGHLMTDGRWLGHAGYGGQFLMVDTETGLACAYLSVLENESGYDVDYMAETIACLQAVVDAARCG